MYYFCTYFDKHYLARGLALYHSLKQHCSSFKIWVLCLDKETHERLSRLALSDVSLISIEEFEKEDHKLLLAKQNRSLIEYYFTCTPTLPLFILNNWPEVNLITYLDADLYFFSNLEPIFNEINGYSIAIIEHRYPEYLRHLERNGIYNVSWMSFRSDNYAIECLRRWRGQCLEWCYDRYEDDRFADQKYLDDWLNRFSNIIVLKHKGIGVAPWNVKNHKISSIKEKVFIDGIPLIFFHFQGLQFLLKCLIDPNLARYGINNSSSLKKYIYDPYFKKLYDVKRWISYTQPSLTSITRIKSIRLNNKKADNPFYRNILDRIFLFLDITKKIIRGHIWPAFWGKII